MAELKKHLRRGRRRVDRGHYKKIFNRPFGPIVKTVDLTVQTIDELNMENNLESWIHQLKNC